MVVVRYSVRLVLMMRCLWLNPKDRPRWIGYGRCRGKNLGKMDRQGGDGGGVVGEDGADLVPQIQSAMWLAR